MSNMVNSIEARRWDNEEVVKDANDFVLGEETGCNLDLSHVYINGYHMFEQMRQKPGYQGFKLPEKMLHDCKINKARLKDLRFENNVFYGVDFTETNFTKVSFIDCTFEQCNFKHAMFNDVLMKNSSFYECNFEFSFWHDTMPENTSFAGGSMQDADIKNALMNASTSFDSVKGVVEAGRDQRGYHFMAYYNSMAGWHVKAGCRWLTIAEAWLHWFKQHRDNENLRQECLARLALLEKMCRLHDERHNLKQEVVW